MTVMYLQEPDKSTETDAREMRVTTLRVGNQHSIQLGKRVTTRNQPEHQSRKFVNSAFAHRLMAMGISLLGITSHRPDAITKFDDVAELLKYLHLFLLR